MASYRLLVNAVYPEFLPYELHAYCRVTLTRFECDRSDPLLLAVEGGDHVNGGVMPRTKTHSPRE